MVALLVLLERHECKGFRLVAIDLVEGRRNKAKAILDLIKPKDCTYAIAPADEAKDLVAKWTDGIGCNAVIEVSWAMLFVFSRIVLSCIFQAVGYNSALTLSYDLVRPFGVIASVGVHQDDQLPLTVRVPFAVRSRILSDTRAGKSMLQ